MADNRTRFSDVEFARAQKTGEVSFLASVLGIKPEAVKRTKSGYVAGDILCTVSGRRDTVANLKALPDKHFNAAMEAGFVQFLAEAWGVTFARLTYLRENGYQDTRAPTPTPVKAPSEVVTPVARFHSHDSRKSHPVAQAHRG